MSYGRQPAACRPHPPAERLSPRRCASPTAPGPQRVIGQAPCASVGQGGGPNRAPQSSLGCPQSGLGCAYPNVALLGLSRRLRVSGLSRRLWVSVSGCGVGCGSGLSGSGLSGSGLSGSGSQPRRNG